MSSDLPYVPSWLGSFQGPHIPVGWTEAMPTPSSVIASYRAALSNPVNVAPLKDVVRPWSEYLQGLPAAGNRLVWRRDEPILRMGLSRYIDEREWEAMEQSEIQISTSLDAVTQRLLAEGWTITAGGGGQPSPAAVDFRDFAQAMLRGLKEFETVLDCITAKVPAYGWQPIQILPTTFKWRGMTKRGIGRVINQRHCNFSFTMDTSDLVFLGDGMQPPQVLDAPDERAAFMALRWGSTYSPFGKAKLASCWFQWDMLQRLKAIYELGAYNALMGIPVFSRDAAAGGSVPFVPTTGGSPGSDQTALTTAFVSQVRDVLRVRKEVGAIILGPGMKMDDLKAIETIDGCLRAIQDARDQLQLALQGEQLTSTHGSPQGSYALGKVHAETGEGRAKRVGRTVAEGINQILRAFIDYNFPGPIAEEDYPFFRFNLESQIDPEKLQVYVAMGGEVDAEEVARAWNIPVSAGTKGNLLKRQDPNALPGAMLASLGIGPKPPQGALPPAPDRPQLPPAPPPPARSAERALPASSGTIAEHTDQAEAAIAEVEGARVAGAVTAYLSAMRDAAIHAAGDADLPKA